MKSAEDKGKSYSPSRSSSTTRVNSRENKVRKRSIIKYESQIHDKEDFILTVFLFYSSFKLYKRCVTYSFNRPQKAGILQILRAEALLTTDTISGVPHKEVQNLWDVVHHLENEEELCLTGCCG